MVVGAGAIANCGHHQQKVRLGLEHPHHKKLNLPTYPNYKHDGSEENVISSLAPMLLDVLQEIAARVESSLQIERKISSYRRLWWFASPKSDLLPSSDRQSPYAEQG